MDFIHNSPQFHALINAATEAKEAEKSPGLSGAAGPAKGGMSVLQLPSPTGLYSPDLGSKSFNARRKSSNNGEGNGAGSAPSSPVLSSSGRPHKRVRTQFDDEEEKIPVERNKKADKVTSGGSSCHQCKSRRNYSDLTYCTSALNKKNKQSAACRKKYCDHCLKKFYHETPIPNQSWKCPSCRHICCCAACRRRETRDRPERKASPRFSPKPAPRSASQSPRTAPLPMPSNSPYHNGSSRSPYTKAANPANPANGNVSPYVAGGYASERKDSNGTRIFTPNGVRGRIAPISPHMKPLPASALGTPARGSSASPDDDDDDYSDEEDSDEDDDDDDDDYGSRAGSRARSRSQSQSRSMKSSNTIINTMTSINKSPLLAAARFLTTNPAPMVTPGHSPTLNGYNPAAVRRSPAVTPRMTPRLSPPPVPVYPSVLSLDSSSASAAAGANAGDSMAQFNSVLQRSTSMLSMSSISSSGTGDQRLLLSQIAPAASSSSVPVLASVEGAQAFTTLYAVASLPQNKAAMEQIMSNAALSDSEKVSQVSALLSQSLSTLNPHPRRLSLSTSTSSENGFCLGASSPASIASSSSFNPSPSSSSGRPPLPSPPSSPPMSPVPSPTLTSASSAIPMNASVSEAVVPEVLLSLTRSPMISSHPVSASPPSMSMGKSILTQSTMANTMGTSLLSTVNSTAAVSSMLPMATAVPANTVIHATPTITVTPPTTNATAATTATTIVSATPLA